MDFYFKFDEYLKLDFFLTTLVCSVSPCYKLMSSVAQICGAVSGFKGGAGGVGVDRAVVCVLSVLVGGEILVWAAAGTVFISHAARVCAPLQQNLLKLLQQISHRERMQFICFIWIKTHPRRSIRAAFDTEKHKTLELRSLHTESKFSHVKK